MFGSIFVMVYQNNNIPIYTMRKWSSLYTIQVKKACEAMELKIRESINRAGFI